MFDEAAKFAFEIGQTVRHKSQPQIVLVVVEQVLTRCHGGIQRLYLCSYVDGRGFHRVHLSEDELEGADEVDVLIGRLDDLSRRVGRLAERHQQQASPPPEHPPGG